MRNCLNQTINFEKFQDSAIGGDNTVLSGAAAAAAATQGAAATPAQDGQLTYLPTTFEGMIESFGVNLQRKQLYTEFYNQAQDVESCIKNKNVSSQSLRDKAEHLTASM